jgi:integrase
VRNLVPSAMSAPPTNLSTPAKRRKLLSGKVHWTAIGGERGGIILGYRRGPRGGSWVAKLVLNERRAEVVIGRADDRGQVPKALSHQDAIREAGSWAASERRRIELGIETAPEVRSFTVADAVRAYIGARERRNPITGRDARSRLSLHVIADGKFSGIALTSFTANDCARWRKGLSKGLRPATVNRLQNDLKAALRASIEQYWRDLPLTLPKEIESGLRSIPMAEVARHALLSDDEVRCVVEAAYATDPDLGALVLVLAATGARFSQAARITVADVQANAERIMVPTSAKGNGAKARARIAVAVGSDVIERLSRLIEGRRGSEFLLTRWVHRQVGPMEWARIERSSWATAALMQRGWHKALALARLPHVAPYALRHSSIVRQLREGLPVRVVAGLHDTSTAMIERHYSAHILDMADELARRAITPLVRRETSPRALLAAD